jgi:hypothetical protein
MKKSQPYTIRVFPNSGHQYFYVPLTRLITGKDEEALRAFVSRNTGGWKPLSPATRWILFRYTADERNRPCIHLAIETNLGTEDRGLIFDNEEIVDAPPDMDEQIPAYAAPDILTLFSDYDQGILPIHQLPGRDGQNFDVNLQIQWVQQGGEAPVDVDLIVDLGNTRTIALLLETPSPEREPFAKRAQILRFLPRGHPYAIPGFREGGAVEDEFAIIDSWFLLHRPVFAAIEPPMDFGKLTDHYWPIEERGRRHYEVRRYMPHTFVEISPALIGGGRAREGAGKIFAGLRLNTSSPFFLSSPKRYAWDGDPQGVAGGLYWVQIPNDSDPDIPPDYFVPLRGLFRYFMAAGGSGQDLLERPSPGEFRGHNQPDAPATYSRSEAICWFALAIIEAAHRQMNSQDYLQAVGRESLPRRMRQIRVTYPAGWTHEERTNYLGQWERALRLFANTRFADTRPVGSPGGGEMPVLAPQPVDEAVCSQLPILLSDIRNLCGDLDDWFACYGRAGAVRIMNLDIGGGTTDIAILEYRCDPEAGTTAGAPPSLVSRLLHRDGYSVAGDVLVKKVIEQILMPAWLEASGLDQYAGIPDALTRIGQFFQRPSDQMFIGVDTRARARIARVTRLVFIPLVNRWLAALAAAEKGQGDAWGKLSIRECLEQQYLDENVINELNRLIRDLIRKTCRNGTHYDGTPFATASGIFLTCDRLALEQLVDQVFSGLYDYAADLLGRFDCHMVILSGKPSEIPRIRNSLMRHLPLPTQRIVSVKDFPAGTWYPFRTFEENRILDAKTCTVVGAALYQDMLNHAQEGIRVRDATDYRAPPPSFWGIVNEGMDYDAFHRSLIFQPADCNAAGAAQELHSQPKEIEVSIPCRIGRMLSPQPGLRPEPVYELRYRGAEPMAPGRPFAAKVTLQWYSRAGEGEGLALKKTRILASDPLLDPDRVELRLNTLMHDSFWLDDPQFDTRAFPRQPADT